MNNLSWMIYLADVTGTFGSMLILFLVLAVAALVTALCAFLGTADGPTIYSFDSQSDREEKIRGYRRLNDISRSVMKKAPVAIAALALFVIAVPSSSTIYAIAASEMGEAALNSDTGSKAVRALDAWLDRQISSESDGNPKGEDREAS